MTVPLVKKPQKPISCNSNPINLVTITAVADGKSSPLGDEGLMFAGGICISPCLSPGRDYAMANLSVNLYTVNEPWLYSILWCAGVQSVTSDSSHVLRKVPSPIWLMVSVMLGKVL